MLIDSIIIIIEKRTMDENFLDDLLNEDNVLAPELLNHIDSSPSSYGHINPLLAEFHPMEIQLTNTNLNCDLVPFMQEDNYYGSAEVMQIFPNIEINSYSELHL